MALVLSLVWDCLFWSVDLNDLVWAYLCLLGLVFVVLCCRLFVLLYLLCF